MLTCLSNDNNVTRVKLERIEMNTCSTINIRLSTLIFWLPMLCQGKQHN